MRRLVRRRNRHIWMKCRTWVECRAHTTYYINWGTLQLQQSVFSRIYCLSDRRAATVDSRICDLRTECGLMEAMGRWRGGAVEGRARWFRSTIWRVANWAESEISDELRCVLLSCGHGAQCRTAKQKQCAQLIYSSQTVCCSISFAGRRGL